MIKPKVLLIADNVIQDLTTNRMSLINIFEQFNPTGYPLLIPRFTVFAMTERDITDPPHPEAKLNIKLDGEILFDQPIEINFGENSIINRSIMKFQGFVIPKPGVLIATITVAGESLDSYRISAFAGPMPKPQQVA